ncbi:MAG: type IV pilus twitching motility protein PilT, partial [Candidatus Omnitrophota bacterium]
DMHLQAGTSPVFRVHGDLIFSDLEPLSNEDIEKYLFSVMSAEQKERYLKERHLDLSYTVPGIARFRANVFRQRGNAGIVLRMVPFDIPTMEDLGLPSVLADLASRPHGLVLFTGATGSGKSTSLAAIINFINNTRKAKIVTIEDPIEFVHSNRLSVIDQREVGADTESFSMALRDALREDPDVILVGEMRDLDTISNAITAAETGHLVFATLHTNDSVQAIDRMIDVFPPHQQAQVRSQLAVTLQAVIAQTLLKRKEGLGRVAAFETLVVNNAVRNLIKEAKTLQIYSAIQTGRQDGMQSMREFLKQLCARGTITPEEAALKVVDAKAFEVELKGSLSMKK